MMPTRDLRYKGSAAGVQMAKLQWCAAAHPGALPRTLVDCRPPYVEPLQLPELGRQHPSFMYRSGLAVPLNLRSLAIGLEIGAPEVRIDLHWLRRQRFTEDAGPPTPPGDESPG